MNNEYIDLIHVMFHELFTLQTKDTFCKAHKLTSIFIVAVITSNEQKPIEQLPDFHFWRWYRRLCWCENARKLKRWVAILRWGENL